MQKTRSGILTFGRMQAALSALVIFSGTSALAEQVWVMPTPYSESTFHTVNIRMFAEEVERLTGGELKIEIHPGGTLFPHGEIATAVADGKAQIGEVFQSTLSSRNPAFSADSIPFLATSYGDAEVLYAAEADILTQLLKEEGLVPLFAVPWPPQGMYSRVEIADPAEMKGMAFRTYNATLEQLAGSLGAIPTPLEAKDIPEAFLNGEIDVMITSATTGASTKSWEYLGFYYDLQAWVPKNLVFANADALAALTPENRAAVFEAAEFAKENGWLLSQVDAVVAIKTLFENGMTILTPGSAMSSDATDGGAMREISPALLDRLEKIGAEIQVDWTKEAGQSGSGILNTYREESQ